MAEVVNRNSEGILPQFEEIIKLRLFTPSEMRKIIQRHVEYEYKTVKREKQKSDFEQYVTYKIDLLKLVRARMKLKNVNKKEKRKVEKMLIGHISKLYNTMTKYNPTDESLWLDYINFMMKEKNFAKVVVLYDTLLSLNMSNVELFLNAAKFMIRYIKDIDLARKILFKGIRLHKRNELLYLEFFQIELNYAAKKRKECEKDSEKLMSDPVLCGKTAEVICISALKIFDNLHFKISLLKISSKYKFMRSLQEKLYKMTKKKHQFDVELWKNLALLQLEDINFENIDMKGLKSTELVKQRIWRCYHIFLEAVKIIPGELTWYHFLDTFFDLLKSYQDESELIQKLLLGLMSKNETKNFREQYFVRWIESCEDCYHVDELMPLIDVMLSLHPQSAALWIRKLKSLQNQTDGKTFNEMFDQALSNVKEEEARCLLWQFALQCYDDMPISQIDKVSEKMMNESLTYPILRFSYMDWIIKRNDLLLARKVFSNLIRRPPYDVELFKKMVNLELSQPQVDAKEIRSLFTMAGLYFGATNTDIWLEFIQFEKLHGDVGNVTNLYWQAVKQLEPSLSDKFIAEYSLSKAA